MIFLFLKNFILLSNWDLSAALLYLVICALFY